MLLERLSLEIHVDPDASHPDRHLTLMEMEILIREAPVDEFATIEDEHAFASQIPLPSVKRASNGLQLKTSCSERQRRGPMGSDVVVRLDCAVIDTNDYNWVFGNIVDDIVSRKLELIQPAGHLPDAGPQP